MKRFLFSALMLVFAVSLQSQSYDTDIKTFAGGGIAAWNLESAGFNQGVTFGAGVVVESGRAADQAAYFTADVSYTSLYDSGRQRYLQSTGGIGITNRNGLYGAFLATYMYSPSDEIDDLGGLGLEARGTIPLNGNIQPYFMARGFVLSNGRFAPTLTAGVFYSFKSK